MFDEVKHFSDNFLIEGKRHRVIIEGVFILIPIFKHGLNEGSFKCHFLVQLESLLILSHNSNQLLLLLHYLNYNT